MGLSTGLPIGLHHVCAGLSHFLNYCWGVLDQAQNGFDDVITQIYLVSTLMHTAYGLSKDMAFDQLPEILQKPCLGELADLTTCNRECFTLGFRGSRSALTLPGDGVYFDVCGIAVHTAILGRRRHSHSCKCTHDPWSSLCTDS